MRPLIRRLTAITLAALSLAGCTQIPEEPMRIGTNVWIGYEPLYLARAQGQLKPNKVKLVEYVSSTQVMRSLIDGAVDAAALTLDEALLLKQHGVDIRIVLVMDYSAGADALLAYPGIKSLQALRGRRIGVETTALGAYMMHRVLEMAGLTLSDINLVSLDLAQHEQAYLEGKVDAVITFDPVRSRLLAKGANALLDTRALPGEVVDVLVVRNDYLSRHKEHLKLLLEQWFRAVDHIEKTPISAAHFMNARMKLGETELMAALQGVKFPAHDEDRQLLTNAPSPLERQAQHLSSVMEGSHLLRGPVQVAELFDHQLLQELYPQ